MAQDHTSPDRNTRDAEAHAARAAHDADGPASPEEEKLAEANDPDSSVAEAHKEANERGAAQKGEGRVP